MPTNVEVFDRRSNGSHGADCSDPESTIRLRCASMGPDRRSTSPTMEDVAAVAGVSRALVSLVMRDSPKVSVHSRALVTAAAATLGYRPNLVARNLASRRTMTVGVVLDDLHNPWFAEVTDGLHEVLASDGYDMLLASGQRSRAVETRALETFLASRVDGIIVMGSRVDRKSTRLNSSHRNTSRMPSSA